MIVIFLFLFFFVRDATSDKDIDFYSGRVDEVNSFVDNDEVEGDNIHIADCDDNVED